jgi:hypothetical protein
LADNHGGLGKALARNRYFVSDTNYGWGPDSIGDRTDITNWPEWFTGPKRDRYLNALYGESEKHAPYSRPLSDPGGKNRIIMFKSCFPNSNLEGNSDDPPVRGQGLTVKNAKAIYNELLAFFATRPHTLFVVITAPPVQDNTHGANARAFNTWLVRNWLSGYKGNNVAVFDFYNVLTGPDNHHRFHNGAVQYITDRGKNTLYYPTNGDDHPSPAGNRKATKEFVPLLNVYYHRWQKGAPAQPLPKEQAAPAPSPSPASPEKKAPEPSPEKPPAVSPATVMKGGTAIDSFESGSKGWAAFLEHGKDTRIVFALDRDKTHEGQFGLRIEYDIAPGSWGACSKVYAGPRDWRDAAGLSLYIRSQRPDQEVAVVAYQGKTSDDLSHFEFKTKTGPAAVSGWRRLDIRWNQMVQPPWQGDSSVPFDPAKAMGIAFIFTAPEGGRNTGHIWVDDIRLLSKAGSGKARK